MKGEVSRNVIAGLVVLLLVVSLIGAASVTYAMVNKDVTPADSGAVTDTGSVDLYIPGHTPTVGQGTVGLTVET